MHPNSPSSSIPGPAPIRDETGTESRTLPDQDLELLHGELPVAIRIHRPELVGAPCDQWAEWTKPEWTGIRMMVEIARSHGSMYADQYIYLDFIGPLLLWGKNMGSGWW